MIDLLNNIVNKKEYIDLKEEGYELINIYAAEKKITFSGGRQEYSHFIDLLNCDKFVYFDPGNTSYKYYYEINDIQSIMIGKNKKTGNISLIIYYDKLYANRKQRPSQDDRIYESRVGLDNNSSVAASEYRMPPTLNLLDVEPMNLSINPINSITINTEDYDIIEFR